MRSRKTQRQERLLMSPLLLGQYRRDQEVIRRGILRQGQLKPIILKASPVAQRTQALKPLHLKAQVLHEPVFKAVVAEGDE